MEAGRLKQQNIIGRGALSKVTEEASAIGADKQHEMEMLGTLPLAVVIPVYNAAPYLCQCLDSVLAQTRPVREIICVNDGSTDESGTILDQYAAAHSCIEVLHKKNEGPLAARRDGVQLVTSLYVASVDADDFVAPEMFASLMDVALREDADIVTSGFFREYGEFQMADPDPLPVGCYRGTKLAELQSRMILLDRFFRSSVASSLCGKVYKAELLRRCQRDVDPRIFMGEDIVIILPMILHAKCVCALAGSYYHYRNRTDSMAGERKKDDAERVAIFLKELKKRFSTFIGHVPNIMTQWYFIHTYIDMMQHAESALSRNGEDLYPFGRVPQDAEILLYGSGKFGRELKEYLDRHGYHIVAWVDKSPSRPGVVLRDVIPSLAYDIVLISIIKANIADEAVEDLKQLGVPPEKIRRIDAKLIREVAERELAGETKFFE